MADGGSVGSAFCEGGLRCGGQGALGFARLLQLQRLVQREGAL